MKPIFLSVAAMTLVIAGWAQAQSSATGSAGTSPGAGAAAAPGPGAKPTDRPAPGQPPAKAPKLSEANTPGWSMMSTQERAEHHAAMGATKTYDECHALAMKHHEHMKEKAQAQGKSVRAKPRRDPCDFLKKK